MNKLALVAATVIAQALCCRGFALESPTNPARQVISLDGDWLFQRDGAKSDDWKTISVPAGFDQHEGIDFHGVGWYRKVIPAFPLPAGKRVLLHFQAAATEAEVWWNGRRVGTHLGGWTPFRCDITEDVRKAAAGRPHELRVRLDEKVGHNTQGFLPIIAPHFGGLWQDVQLLVVPETYCDDLNLLAVGNLKTCEIQLDIPLCGKLPVAEEPVRFRCRLRGQADWFTPPLRTIFAKDRLQVSAKLTSPRPWSPDEPNLYEVALTIGGKNGDRVCTRVGFRTIEAFGPELRLNGRPLQVRGVLNWGYSPPLAAPNPGEAVWRQEIEMAQRRGFNAMKFCLWVPPRRYLELADELGMLVWMEYPTWHPTLTRQFIEPLRREFGEFFHYDRNHPSVILRSLTCETGPSAELPVIRSLYDLAKATIPGALVEDDSSWIGWNRVCDFYDDHPYGNNHTCVKTLQGFNRYILAHGVKPLLLGEAIAADTWIDREAILARVGTQRPWWLPGFCDEIPRWLERMRQAAGPISSQQLRDDSLRYAMLMRKFQIEAYRREVPYGGYNVSVIRDFSTASMGLLDYLGRPKWSAADWAWQGDTMCLLKTEADRRSFAAGGRLRGEILLSHFGREPIANGQLQVVLQEMADRGEILQRCQRSGIEQNVGTLSRLAEFDWALPPTKEPRHLLLSATLQTAQGEFRNAWPLWLVPSPRPDWAANVRLHSSISDETAKDLFPGARRRADQFSKLRGTGILPVAEKHGQDARAT
ncbi:MAG: sugar-binding domain-containing protein, partial [Thermoguttaceae bacterium]